MAKKVIACKAAPELELQFDGGESLTLRFDMRTLAEIREAGCLDWITSGDISEVDVCATVIYAGAISAGDPIEIERAKLIAMSMPLVTVTDILDEFTQSMGVQSQEAKEELAKKTMAQFVAQKMKGMT